MTVFHISSECYPIAKVGGLADVVGSLPKYLNRLGITAKVVMPWYNKPFVQDHKLESVHESVLYISDQTHSFEVLKEKKDSLGFEIYFIKIEGLLDRDEVYGYWDSTIQFIAFQRAVLQWMQEKEIQPDVIHCHDHHTGLIPFFMKHSNDYPLLKEVKTVGTIHNAEYQGNFSWDFAYYFPYFDREKWGLLDWNGQINSLACMVKCADAYTTVSEGYMDELYNYWTNSLGYLFNDEREKSHGITNGIDYDVWNPETDEMIDFNYKISNYTSMKKSNKKQLCKEFGLNEDLPLFAFIGRFAREKGADLLPEVIERIIPSTQGQINIIILGSGNWDLENYFKYLQDKYHYNLAVEFGYREDLSHKIYASADFLLMPSRVEPCGLNQMYSMRYGTIPIVRYTGGLKSSVFDVTVEGDGRGFVFADDSVNSIVHAVYRALDFYYTKDCMKNLRKHDMNLDFSWDNSAKKYINLYESLK